MTTENNHIDIPNFVLIPSQHNENVMVPCIKGNVFNKNTGDYYVCRHYKSSACPVRVKLLKNENGEYVGFVQTNSKLQHNHEAVDYYNYLQKQKIKRYAEENKFTDKNVVEIATEITIPQSTLRPSTVAKSIRKELGITTKGTAIKDIELTPEEKENLLFRNNNMIVFADKKNINILKDSPIVASDGTFRVSPSLFLFCILLSVVLYFLIELLLIYFFSFFYQKLSLIIVNKIRTILATLYYSWNV